MCGICGCIYYCLRGQALPLVEKMLDCLRHRGADSRGSVLVSSEPEIVLGHTRLAIIDTSDAARQPMTDPETGNVVVFNGELFNYKELRAELQALGVELRSSSDTEVLLLSYRQWGIDVVPRLRGCFAFAMWDAREKKLLLVRDQLGSKPLYYAKRPDGMLFASEVRTLLEAGVPKKISKCGLKSYLAFGSVQEPWTIVDGIEILPPGSMMICSGNDTETRLYWDPDLSPKSWSSKEEVQEAVTNMLKEVISQQIVSDVPLGAFLSGGIDSSAIVGLIRSVYSGQINTFSIVFDDPEFDERQYARLAAERNDTHHTELLLDGQTMRKNLFPALEDFDQPCMDGLNTWFISKLVREAGITVAIAGLGGDELFAGYNRFERFVKLYKAARLVRHFPAFLGAPMVRWGRSEKIRKFGQLFGNSDEPYFMVRRILSENQIGKLVRPEIASSDYHPAEIAGVPDDLINRISIYELKNYIVNTALRDADQMSMAQTIEARSPLLDHKLVELMLSIPGDMKLDPKVPKPLLVRAAGDRLPLGCVFRHKRGFVLPFDEYFKAELHDEIKRFSEARGDSFFEPTGLKNMIAAYNAGRVNWSRIWMLYVLDFYCRHNRLSL